MPTAAPRAPSRTERPGRLVPDAAAGRRREAAAALAVAGLLVCLVTVPVTTGLVIAARVVDRLTRWRASWLAAPAVCGLVWVLMIGLPAATASLTAMPRAVLPILAAAVHDPRVIAGLPRIVSQPWRMLSRQLPAGLLLAAGLDAALRAVAGLRRAAPGPPAPRPGLVCWARGLVSARLVRSGGVLSRDGACLGTQHGSGRPAGISWSQAQTGILMVAATPRLAAESGFQVLHAAVRRRKPVIALDLVGNPDLAGRLRAACAVAGAPLYVVGPGGDSTYGHCGHEPQSREITLAAVVRRRAVVLFSLGPRGGAAPGCASAETVLTDLAGLAAGAHQASLMGDTLLWCAGCEAVDAGLLRAGRGVCPARVLVTTDPECAAALAPDAAAVVVHGPAGAELAGALCAVGGDGDAGEGVPAGHLTSQGAGEFTVLPRGKPGGTLLAARFVAARVPRPTAGHSAIGRARPAGRSGMGRPPAAGHGSRRGLR